MNLDGIPVIDTHAHPFPPAQGAIPWEALRDAIAVDLRAETTADNDSMLLSRMVLRRLGSLLGVDPTPAAVMEARNAIAADPAAWNRMLFTDAGVAAVLVDPGFPSATIEAADFQAVIPCPVYDGYRIERFAKGPSQETPYDYDAYASFADLVEDFRAKLDAEAAKPETVFYKSIIAYRTGLALTTPTEAEALATWKERPAYRTPGEKLLRDFLFRETALKALEHDLAFQVHTGHTSHDQPWRNANPIEMTLFLNSPRMDQVRFVLVHGGYPFNTEAGYITSVYPNVFLDFSLMIPWSSIGIADRIWQTLESAPTTKLMYGSDGIMVPELFWISAHNARRALGKVLDRLLEDDIVDEAEAESIAHDILHRTAGRVYGVTEGTTAGA
ncbi:MAG: amidohydrolase family protein [Thermomicrobiales bacterium]